MKLETYKAEHLLALQLQPNQEYLAEFVTPEHAKLLENCEAYTAKDDDGQVLICAGAIKIWKGRFYVWTYISRNAGKNFLAIHKATLAFLDTMEATRLETTVDCGFLAGHRWIKMLGFVKEADVMRKYRPDGGDCSLYARVK